MELDTLRRKGDEDKHFFRNKNQTLRQEIEDLVKENKKISGEKATLTSRLTSLR